MPRHASRYEVFAANIGRVYNGHGRHESIAVFRSYVDRMRQGDGRIGCWVERVEFYPNGTETAEAVFLNEDGSVSR